MATVKVKDIEWRQDTSGDWNGHINGFHVAQIMLGEDGYQLEFYPTGDEEPHQHLGDAKGRAQTQLNTFVQSIAEITE